MKDHIPATTILSQLDALISRMNALEANSPNGLVYFFHDVVFNTHAK